MTSKALVTITTEPTVRVRDGEVYANSRAVADHFGKEHRRVLQDIRALVKSAALSARIGAQWFVPSTYQARVGYGMKTLPAYDMTKDGFALLVMGFTTPANIYLDIYKCNHPTGG